MVLLAAAVPAAAHSLKYVEDQLRQDERYLQLMNQPAPNFTLEDANGTKVSLEDFKGKVVVLNFIYARCKEECPLQSALIATIQKQVNQTPMREQVQFVSIATDTEDAPATATVMRSYGETHGLDASNWMFLYGGSARPGLGMALARAYGLKFVPTGDGEQMHGVVSFLIDQEGVLKARYLGLKFNPVNLIMHAAALLHENEHSTDTASANTGAALRPPAFGWLHIASGTIGLGLIVLAAAWLRRSRGRERG